MSLDSTSQLGQMLANNANETQDVAAAVSPDEDSPQTFRLYDETIIVEQGPVKGTFRNINSSTLWDVNYWDANDSVWNETYSTGFILNSATAGVLGTNLLGDPGTDKELVIVHNKDNRFIDRLNTDTYIDTSESTVVEGDGEYLFDTVVVDKCNSVTGWSSSLGSLTINGLTTIEGYSSLNCIKSSTSSSDFNVLKNQTPFDGTDKYINVWYYVKDQTALDKIANLEIFLGTPTPGVDHFHKGFAKGSVGWNLLSVEISTMTQTGSPTIASITQTRLDINTNNATDLFASGDIIMDYWYLTESESQVMQSEIIAYEPEDSSSYKTIKNVTFNLYGTFIDNAVLQVKTDSNAWEVVTQGTKTTLANSGEKLYYKIGNSTGASFPTPWGTWGVAATPESMTITDIEIYYEVE